MSVLQKNLTDPYFKKCYHVQKNKTVFFLYLNNIDIFKNKLCMNVFSCSGGGAEILTLVPTIHVLTVCISFRVHTPALSVVKKASYCQCTGTLFYKDEGCLLLYNSKYLGVLAIERVYPRHFLD